MSAHRLPADLRKARFPTSSYAFWTPNGILMGWGTTVGNSIEGWAPGATFIDTDAAAGQQNWVNEGSVTSATWSRKEAGSINLINQETINVGTQGNTASTAVATLSSSLTGVVRSFADDGGASVATSVRNVQGRTLLTVDQTGGSIRSVQGQLKMLTGVDVTSGIYTAVQGYVEMVGTHSAKTGSTFSCIDASMEITTALTVDSGGEACGIHIETTGAGTITNNGTCAAILISNASGAPDWPYAMYVVGTDVSNGILMGTSGAPITLASVSNAGFTMYTTCASAHASNSIEPFYMKSTMTGANGVGGRARFHMTTNVALGGWCNALKAYMEFGATGRVTGLASALCTDLLLSVGTTQGNYTCLEANIIANSAVSTGTATSFIRCNIAGTDGTGVTTINTNGYFFDIGEGIADTSDGMFEAETVGAVSATHVLRVRIDGVPYWLALNTAKTM